MSNNTDVEKSRRSHVQALRKLAVAYEVERVPDNAKKERIEHMVGQLREATLSDKDKESLEGLWKAYRETWPNWAPGGEPDQEVEATTRWGFKAGQLTYNSKAGAWISKVPGVLEELLKRLVAFIQVALKPHWHGHAL